MKLRHGSLFSGGGGFDIAAQLVEWENIFHCEWNPFCQRILKYYWPKAETYKDIKEFNATKFKGIIDILSGGFPCQPFSTAGKRRGTDDTRYLWPEMLRVIRECQPRWVVGENVFGLVDWDGGLVFDQVHTDLEAEGYEVQAFVLPASGVNAPHRRYRVWFVACRDSAIGADAANAIGKRLGRENRHRQAKEASRKRATNQFKPRNRIADWNKWPTQSPFLSGNDGFPGRLDGITFPKWRNESVKIYGNAIVPQVAQQIFNIINLIESER